MFTGAELCSKLPPGRDPEGGLCEGQAGRVGTGEPPGHPSGRPGLPTASTDCDAAGVGHCAAIKSLLQGSDSELIQVQVIQGRL